MTPDDYATLTAVMSRASTVPRLTREQETALAADLRSPDPDTVLAARNMLVLANIGFVVTLAIEHVNARNGLYPLEDILAVGLEALTAHAVKFDPAKGGNFRTFIKPWVRKAFGEYTHTASVLTVPRYLHIDINKVLKAEERLVARLGVGTPLTDAMVAEECGFTVERVLDLRVVHATFRSGTVSLDAPVHADVDLVSTLPDPTVDVEQQSLEVDGFSPEVADLLDGLSSVEYQVVMLTAGMFGEEPLSLTAVAARLGMTRTDVAAVLDGVRSRAMAVAA